MTFEKTIRLLKKALSKNEIGWKEFGAVSYILERTKECDVCKGYGYVETERAKHEDCVDCKGIGFILKE